MIITFHSHEFQRVSFFSKVLSLILTECICVGWSGFQLWSLNILASARSTGVKVGMHILGGNTCWVGFKFCVRWEDGEGRQKVAGA